MNQRENINLIDNTEIVLLDSKGNRKRLWNDNPIGRFIRRRLGSVPQNFLFGYYADALRNHNLIPNAGHAGAAGRLGGLGGYAAFVNIAIGVGTTAAAATDTALVLESTTLGAGRGAATATQVTTTVTNDTLQLVKTFTFTGSLAITEEGVFDSATASSGTMLARQVFAAINVANGDSLQFTHKIQA